MPYKDSEQSQWFTEEVLPHEGDVRGWLRGRFPMISDIDDLMQEAFSRLLRMRDSGPVANPRAFLFVVTRNMALNLIRHSKHERASGTQEIDSLSIIDEVSSPRETTARKEELQHLIEAIESLPKRCRQVMTLRKIYGLSQKEIAARLSISVNTVEAQGSIGMRKCIQYFRTRGYLSQFKK